MPRCVTPGHTPGQAPAVKTCTRACNPERYNAAMMRRATLELVTLARHPAFWAGICLIVGFEASFWTLSADDAGLHDRTQGAIMATALALVVWAGISTAKRLRLAKRGDA